MRSLKIRCERHLGDALEKQPEHVGRDRVLESGAGLVRQRDLAEPLQHLVAGDVGVAAFDVGLVVHLLQPRRAHAAGVEEAGGVTQQVLHGDRPLGLDVLEARLPVGAGAAHLDLHVLQLGQPVRHRVAQLEQPLLDHRHRRDRGDRLRHRGEHEDGIGRHGLRLRGVEEAMRLLMHDLALAGDQRHGAGKHAALDLALHRRADPRQALARHSGDDLGTRAFGRLDRHRGAGEHCRGHGRQNQQPPRSNRHALPPHARRRGRRLRRQETTRRDAGQCQGNLPSRASARATTVVVQRPYVFF